MVEKETHVESEVILASCRAKRQQEDQRTKQTGLRRKTGCVSPSPDITKSEQERNKGQEGEGVEGVAIKDNTSRFGCFGDSFFSSVATSTLGHALALLNKLALSIHTISSWQQQGFSINLGYFFFVLNAMKLSLAFPLSPFLNSFINKRKTPKPLIRSLGSWRQKDQRSKVI